MLFFYIKSERKQLHKLKGKTLYENMPGNKHCIQRIQHLQTFAEKEKVENKIILFIVGE